MSSTSTHTLTPPKVLVSTWLTLSKGKKNDIEVRQNAMNNINRVFKDGIAEAEAYVQAGYKKY